MRFSKVLPVTSFLSLAGAISVDSGSLRTNSAVNPIAVDTPTPRVSWRLSSAARGDKQTAFQIQVSTSKTGFETPDLWDSGKVASEDPYASYNGQGLSSRAAAYWRVRVWDAFGYESSWSEVASFEISLLQNSDWKGSWITNPNYIAGNTSTPIFAKEFKIECNVYKARLYLLGLGVHIATLNSKAVTDAVLEQGYSTVNKTLLYSTYDVTSQLNYGGNVLGVEVGKGTYNSEKPLLGRYTKFSINPPRPMMMISQLEYTCEDGTTAAVYSDDTWVSTVKGPYVEGHWYGGEEYDARKEIKNWASVCGSREGWDKTATIKPPTGLLVSPRSPPLKVVKKLPPVALKQVRLTL
jgi:hypothetical protein